MMDDWDERLWDAWIARDSRDFGEMRRWLTGWNAHYARSKNPADRRACMLAQLQVLSEFAEALCPGELTPIRHLILALLSLGRGVQSDLLIIPKWEKPKPITEALFRARMAAATQMYHETGKKLTGDDGAASLVIRQAGTPDVDIGQLENWRQAFLRGDPETDIGALYYHLWTNPKSGIVVGPFEGASGTDDPQANIDVAKHDYFHPGDLVWSSGGRARTKAQYAELLARTAGQIRMLGLQK